MQPPSKSDEYIESDLPGSLKVKAPIGFCGQGMDWYAPTAPAGWLICDGSLVNKNDYPDLWALLGDTWGTSTATQFYLPDMRGRVAVGLDASQAEFTPFAKKAGHKLMQAHSHTTSASAFFTGGGFWASGSNYNLGFASGTGSAGGGNSENLQPYAVVNKIIKT